jgi:small subunit ribosomal protein S4
VKTSGVVPIPRSTSAPTAPASTVSAARARCRTSASSTYQEAARIKGDTGQNLIGLLEQRLDMVVYRAKFAPTIFAARQIVSHGHIYLNGKKTNIASARVKVGDVVSLGSKAKDMALVIEAQSLPEREIPDYVAPDGNDKVTFTRVPKLDEVPYPVTMEPNLVVEFYSR